MKNEEFNSVTLDIVSKAIKKASNGGLIFQPKYQFKLGRIEYLINGDTSPLGDNSQRFLSVFGLEPVEKVFQYYVKSCQLKNKVPTHGQHVVTQLFLAFTSHLIQQGHKDIAFQWRAYGKFHEGEDIDNLRFGSTLVNVRLVRNVKEKGFFRSQENSIPDDLPEGMKETLREQETAFLVRGMDKDFFKHFGVNDLVDFCVDYM